VETKRNYRPLLKRKYLKGVKRVNNIKKEFRKLRRTKRAV